MTHRAKRRGRRTATASKRPQLIWVLTLLLLVLHPGLAGAVLFMSTADPEYNTTAPPSDSGAVGWNLQGTWGSFLGTPIAARYFLTARHVGGTLGDKLVLNGIEYMTTAVFDDPDSDLRIWQVNKDFPAFAELFRTSGEAGQALVVFGRGTQRGDPVSLPGPAGPALIGWLWGPGDGRMRWGQNQVDSIINGDEMMPKNDGTKVGQLLKVSFKTGAGPNQAHLSGGDSGGALFIQQQKVWKLAGINYAVDGPYNLTNSGAGFQAAIVDAGGLYTGEDGNWNLIPASGQPEPGSFYATRVSVHQVWIESVLAQHIVTPTVPVVQSASSAAGPFSEEADASVNVATQTITLPFVQLMQFYRLTASSGLKITQAKVVGSSVVLSYAPLP